MSATLEASFGAVYRQLESPRIARRVVGGLLLVHALLLSYSGYCHSPTLDEPAHLVAGLSYWKCGRFDIYSVNPPLVRMVAALPVMAAGNEENWSAYSAGPGARPEMKLGEDFVHSNGARSLFLIMIARWALIPVSWIGAIVCYLWGRDLYGRPSGVLAAAIWCFEPSVLAHAALITPDATAAALGLAASYLFWRFLKSPNWNRALLAGLVLGIAELTKTTLVLFYPLWPILWLIYRWPQRDSRTARDWLREASMIALHLIVGLYVVNLGYGFEGSFTQVRDFSFVSDAWTGTVAVADPQQLAPGNRFASTWLADAPVPLPRNYVLGVDAQLRDFEHYSRPSYLRGEWRDHGWWYYYIYACAIKVPLGLWVLGLVAILWRLSRTIDPAVKWQDEAALLLPAVAIFAFVSSQTGFNEHLRYVLPALPYFFIAISQTAQLMSPAHARSVIFRPSVLAVLVSWIVASSLWIYPHSLSYFNETIGGPLHAAKHLLGSNLDWGQDLRYTAQYRDKEGRRPDVICYGFVDPVDMGFVSYPEDDYGNVEEHPNSTAVSVDFLCRDPWVMRGNASRRARDWVTAYGQGKASAAEMRPMTYGMYLVTLPAKWD